MIKFLFKTSGEKTLKVFNFNSTDSKKFLQFHELNLKYLVEITAKFKSFFFSFLRIYKFFFKLSVKFEAKSQYFSLKLASLPPFDLVRCRARWIPRSSLYSALDSCSFVESVHDSEWKEKTCFAGQNNVARMHPGRFTLGKPKSRTRKSVIAGNQRPVGRGSILARVANSFFFRRGYSSE